MFLPNAVVTHLAGTASLWALCSSFRWSITGLSPNICSLWPSWKGLERSQEASEIEQGRDDQWWWAMSNHDQGGFTFALEERCARGFCTEMSSPLPPPQPPVSAGDVCPVSWGWKVGDVPPETPACCLLAVWCTRWHQLVFRSGTSNASTLRWQR